MKKETKGYLFVLVLTLVTTSVGIAVGHYGSKHLYENTIVTHKTSAEQNRKIAGECLEREYECMMQYAACTQVEVACMNLVDKLLSAPKKQKNNSESL